MISSLNISHRVRFIMLFILVCLLGNTVSAQHCDSIFNLTIIHTNDFHGYDYDLLARKSTIIKRLKSENSNVLLLEGGDIFSRGKYHKKFWGALEMDVMNMLNYNAWAVGNNELKCASTTDSTDMILSRLVHQASFPTICCNVIMKSDSAFLPDVKPYIILTVADKRIAIIGTTAMRAYAYPQSSNKLVLPAKAEVDKYLSQLKPISDIQILLSHCGLIDDKDIGDSLDSKGLDAIVSADSHIPLFEPLMTEHNIPIVQAGGEKVQYVGILKLTFKLSHNEWKLTHSEGELFEPSTDIAPDPETLNIIKQYINVQ